MVQTPFAQSAALQQPSPQATQGAPLHASPVGQQEPLEAQLAPAGQQEAGVAAPPHGVVPPAQEVDEEGWRMHFPCAEQHA